MITTQIRFYDNSYQYQVIETPVRPLFDMIAGTINELIHNKNRGIKDGWATIIDAETNREICRVKADGNIGFEEDGRLYWQKTNLLNPDYTLIQVSRF